MILFESMLTLMLVAILFLQVSRRLAIPYPAMLAAAGVVVAALPWSPDIGIDPHLALALFIAPALLDAAYDLPPRTLLRNWLPLLALAGVAVLLTTAVVAWLGVVWAGLPLAAAIALGAIVAPPDAAAATAVLGRFQLPRRTVTILLGESLLNDAVALLIFSAAVSVAAKESWSSLLPALSLAVPGGLLFGFLLGRLYVVLFPILRDTLGGTLFQFVATFGAWVLAERLHLSAILAVVTFAMTLGHHVPERQSARERVHSYAVWEATVFLLNVLAFLLMGLQAREIVARLHPSEIWQALGFAGAVLVAVIGTRLLWVMLYNRLVNWYGAGRPNMAVPSLAQGIVVSWCGMRGLVTLATALALPGDFPGRDLILLCALAVVLGTLVLQGLTLGPLIRLLRFEKDTSFDRELASTRTVLLETALDILAEDTSDAATRVRDIYQEERNISAEGNHPREVTDVHRLRRDAIEVKRKKLAELRRTNVIDDDVFHALVEELDWAELASTPPSRVHMEEG